MVAFFWSPKKHIHHKSNPYGSRGLIKDFWIEAMRFCKKNIHIYNFINYNYWLPVTALHKSSSGRRVTSDPTYYIGCRSSVSLGESRPLSRFKQIGLVNKLKLLWHFSLKLFLTLPHSSIRHTLCQRSLFRRN